jgi:hypothetical protein
MKLYVILLISTLFAVNAAGQENEPRNSDGGSRPARRRVFDNRGLIVTPPQPPGERNSPEKGAKRPLAVPSLTSPASVSDAFIRRFAETLDFNSAFREFYVTSPQRRQIVLSSFGVPGIYRFHPALKVNPELVEQIYVAMHDFFALKDLYDLSTSQPTQMWGQGQKLPSEMQAELDRVNSEQAQRPEQTQSVTTQQAAEANARKWLDFYHQSAQVYRRHMPPNPMNTAEYKDNIRLLHQTLKVTPDDPGLATFFGTSADVPHYPEKVIYTVRGPFTFVITQEEDGNFRVYEVNRVITALMIHNKRVRP